MKDPADYDEDPTIQAAASEDDEEQRALALQADAAVTEAVGMAQSPDQELMFLGRAMAGSGFFKDSRRASQAIVKILLGREMGIGPASAVVGLHVFDGKVVISAGLMASMIKRSPQYDFKVISLSDEQCLIRFFENGEAAGDSLFNIEDAKRARLWGKAGPWTQYPKNMMYARALSNGARWYCSGIFMGPVYVPDEMGLEDSDE